jgi:TRAP-type mannitol/chloroaromatic compound transport system substrate-binding protein
LAHVYLDRRTTSKIFCLTSTDTQKSTSQDILPHVYLYTNSLTYHGDIVAGSSSDLSNAIAHQSACVLYLYRCAGEAGYVRFGTRLFDVVEANKVDVEHSNNLQKHHLLPSIMSD